MTFTPPEWTPADRIRKLREARGWKQPDLAEAASVHLDTVVEAEKGRRGMSKRTLQALANALGAPEAWILGDTPDTE